jgi:hypothetical protein
MPDGPLAAHEGIFAGGKGDSPIVRRLWVIAGLCAPTPSTMFVTATHWGQIAEELMREHGVRLSNRNFSVLLVGCLRVVNAGTEDKDVVDVMNEEYAPADFQAKRQALITGRY